MNFLSTTGLPAWVIPAVIVHAALFLTMIVPAWRGFAFARLSGPLALVLAAPLIGLIVVAVIMAGTALRRAGWPVIGVILLFVPVVNVLYMWMFGFGRWTSERAAIQKRTEEAAALAANEDLIEPSQRVQEADISEIPTETGSAPTDSTGDAAAMTDLAGPEIEAAGAPASDPASEPAAAPEEERKPAETGAAAGMTFIAAPGTSAKPDETPEPAPEPVQDRPAQGEPESAAPAPAPPNSTPTPEQDMTYIAGSGGPAADDANAWLIRGIDGRSKNFAMRLHEEDLLDADNGILIGRSNRAHFIINDESVSRNHARLLLIKGQLMVEDLDAMNGVWVGGQRLPSRTPAPLSVGTEFAIGKVNLRVDPVS